MKSRAVAVWILACGAISFGSFVLGQAAERDRLKDLALAAGVDPNFSNRSCVALFK